MTVLKVLELCPQGTGGVAHHLESRKRMWDHPEWRSGSVRRKDQVDFRCESHQCSKDCDHFPGDDINGNYWKITGSTRAKTYKIFQNSNAGGFNPFSPISSISHYCPFTYLMITHPKMEVA